jgi:DNA-binding phage protein
MPLTRDFKETVQARAQRDPAFRRGLFEEAIEAFLSNDTETGKLLLRDYVNATVGFEKLGEELNKSPKSLMRMLSSEGNPRADNLFSVVGHLRAKERGTFAFRPDDSQASHPR